MLLIISNKMNTVCSYCFIRPRMYNENNKQYYPYCSNNYCAVLDSDNLNIDNQQQNKKNYFKNIFKMMKIK